MVKKSEDVIANLEHEDKYKDYCINHMQAEMRLLCDTFKMSTSPPKRHYINMNPWITHKMRAQEMDTT